VFAVVTGVPEVEDNGVYSPYVLTEGGTHCEDSNACECALQVSELRVTRDWDRTASLPGDFVCPRQGEGRFPPAHRALAS
jgi:hypothetical protein